MTDVVLALDISSSGVRARAHDRDLRVVAERALDLDTRVAADGTSGHDLDEVLTAVRAVLRPLAADPRLRPVALAASGTASSLVAMEPGEQARSEVLLWSDTRAAGHYPELAEALAEAYPRTLCPPDVSYWPAKLRYLAERGLRADGRLAGIKDVVFAWLTGALWTDPMTAASSGVFDSAAWRWDTALLSRLGVPSARLPEVRGATDSAPLRAGVAAELGLPAGLPVAAGGMDGPLSQLGAAGTREQVASCTVGTSVAVRAASGTRVGDPRQRTWCYPVTERLWVTGGAGSNGGNLLTWLRDRVGMGGSIPELADAAFGVPADPELLFVPYLNGERAPWWRSELRAAFLGLAAHHGSADLARAVLDGLAAAVQDLAAAVQSVAGRPGQVVFTGGFLQDKRWVQLMTDALGLPAAAPDPDCATSVGVAMLGWAVAEQAGLDEVFTPALRPVAEPDPAEHRRLRTVSGRIAECRRLLWP
ncbi:gluconokinase [Amycolatopsis saalfeldensis]|uniref:Gluconokinase n=1 Tax=Amycolatopsis saalfeldensis TaxID=394193 RepID=A0A1H8XX85_9PSEU|nr:FGGY-family carbohydrate kinase [Amycolatopsis saalfeldensis]SEP44495.1 gluconokinase [Amycolatopsis saalfeldensis]